MLDDCAAMSNQVAQRHDEMVVITTCLGAAVTNLHNHVKSLDQKNAEIQAWAAHLQKQDLNGTDWEASISRLGSIPVSPDMIRFITGRASSRSTKKTTLEDLVDIEDVRRAAKLIRNISTNLTRNGAEVGSGVDEVLGKTDELFDEVEQGPPHTAIEQAAKHTELMEDIEAIAKKVKNDYETVLGYPNNPKSVSQASKSALLHTKSFLPKLTARSLEMEGILQSATASRNQMASHSIQMMTKIAALTAMLAEVNARFASMELDGDGIDAFNLLTMLDTLPVTYGSFLAEAIRRREWYNRVKSDSSTLANEMATFQDEEGRRRRKWQKNTGSILWGERAERKVVGLEVNLYGEEDEWPAATRQDLEELLEILRAQDERSEIVNDLAKIVTELNNPSKQRAKRAKAFKAGSIHEAALGRSTLLVRGDDDLIRSLQEEKTKAEGRLKTAESRVRRLEDLLHRQTHVSRISTGNVFQFPGNANPDLQNTANSLASPRLHDDDSRRSSISSRRFSANQGTDEKAFQQKFLDLEAELNAERERASGLEKEVATRTTSSDEMKTQVEELNSTKKDLLENFEAQQREFIEERKSLEEEIKRLKGKIDELEDEMDRYLGSRENEKANVDERVRTLLDELEKLRKQSTAEAQKAQGQVDFLRNDAKLQRETNESLEKQLQSAKEANSELLSRTARAETAAADQLQVLHDIHAHVLPGSDIPDDFKNLAAALTKSSMKMASELQNVKSEIEVVKSERDDNQRTNSEVSDKLAEVQEKLFAEQAETVQVRETLEAEQAKFETLEAQLGDERTQLRTLRAQIADGETGSENLRSRLEEEERKCTALSEDLAVKQSHIGALEEELRAFQDKYQSAQNKHEKLASRFEARTTRSKDLTQRLYAQNDRLSRLLERLSYSVTREGESMLIQRLPKPERSNANDSSDPGSLLKRSISGAVIKKAMADSGDLDLLYWMHNDDPEIESEKYEAYLNAIGSFDIEAFSEIIAKRVRDVEYTAKKYSKDARSYREKSHIAQKEAHEKIAFKNFKEGDLALFLPTRNQATGAWAAFNVGAPHYFLREQDSHKLRTRDWLVARIHKIEDRVVDLSRSMTSSHLNDRRSLGDISNGGDSFEDDNPFDLSDGLRWYLIDAAEEKPGAPSTPGLGKSTVASANIDATATIRRSKKSSSSGVEGLNKTLTKSLDSRRNSSNSKKAANASSPLSKTGSTTSVAAMKPAPVATTSEAQTIASGSKQDDGGSGSGSGDKEIEVRNSKIDDLMGP